MAIGILDYGMGNLRSVLKAFEKTGADAKIIATPQEVLDAPALVLPGVGSFKKCFQNLDSLKLIQPVLKSIASGKPFLGICLGLQILFTESTEFGISPGLDVIKGRVVRFPADMKTPGGQKLKIPHMGWNAVIKNQPCSLLRDIDSGSFLYFVHSYYVEPADMSAVATTTHYGIDFVSSIAQENIFACQFHPEKSQSVGLRILQNFSNMVQHDNYSGN